MALLVVTEERDGKQAVLSSLSHSHEKEREALSDGASGSYESEASITTVGLAVAPLLIRRSPFLILDTRGLDLTVTPATA